MIVATLPDKKKSKEKPTNLGAKVYKRHRVMLRKMKRKDGTSMNESLRKSIEERHDRMFRTDQD